MNDSYLQDAILCIGKDIQSIKRILLKHEKQIKELEANLYPLKDEGMIE